MRIALLTIHRAPNCGAMLQAWALMRALQQMGHEVELPDCNHIDYRNRTKPFLPDPTLPPLKRLHRALKNGLRNWKARKIFLPTMERFASFVRQHMTESSLAPSAFDSRYDVVVVGSDQLWNEGIMGDDTDLFLGTTVSPGLRIISYGTSFGDNPPTGPAAERVLRAMPRFAAIGVRESRGADFLKACGFEATVTSDPTLLLTPADYLTVASSVPPAERYVYAYSVFFDSRLLELTREVARRRGLRYVYTPLSQYTSYGMPKDIEYGVTPDRFVDLIAHAECVLTDSFHGTALSLIFGKPLVSFCRAAVPAHSRQGELLRMLDCLDWQMRLDASPDAVLGLLAKPLPSEVGERIAAIRAEGRKWLTEQLT